MPVHEFIQLWRTEYYAKNLHAQGRATSISGGRGGLDLTSSLEAKFGTRSGQVHQIKRKTLEVLQPQDAKAGKKSQFWDHI